MDDCAHIMFFVIIRVYVDLAGAPCEEKHTGRNISAIARPPRQDETKQFSH